MFFRTLQIGHQSNMNKKAVFPADFEGDLPDSLNKRLGLNIADRAANLGNDHIRVGFLTDTVNKFLDLIGNVRDHLYG